MCTKCSDGPGSEVIPRRPARNAVKRAGWLSARWEKANSVSSVAGGASAVATAPVAVATAPVAVATAPVALGDAPDGAPEGAPDRVPDRVLDAAVVGSRMDDSGSPVGTSLGETICHSRRAVWLT